MTRSGWRTSSFTNGSGSCVEVAPEWRTSSRSAQNGVCVEVAPTGPSWLVRDTKHRAGGVLTLPDAAFAGLRGYARRS